MQTFGLNRLFQRFSPKPCIKIFFFAISAKTTTFATVSKRHQGMLTKYRLEYTECDFKREVERTKTKNWLKSICAFANGIGGMLVFGIDDKTRQHVPLKDIQSDIEFITDCIKDRVSPVPDFVLAPDVDEYGNEILVLKVKGGLNTPYYLIENSNKTTFIRAGSSTVVADAPILHELILKGTNRTWDTLKSEYLAKDFSFTFLESLYYHKTGNRIEDNDYYSFGLITKDGFLTNAGVLFTDVCPLRQSRIFCTCWNGRTKAPSAVDALDDKEYSGNILQLLSAGEDFIKLHNQKIWYKTPTSRVENESFPTRAVHEAMVNALVHRDYGVLGSEIHIDIFDDRLEIQNPGGMYDGLPVQLQNLENVVSTRRNPVVADLMSRMNFMERRGSGFRKILQAVKTAPNFTENNIPVFRSSAYIFTVEIKNMNEGIDENARINDTINIQNDTINTQNDTINTQNDTIKDGNDTINAQNDTIKEDNVRIKLSDVDVQVLSEIKRDIHITTFKLMDNTGLSKPTISRALKSLKDNGCIARVGSKKFGHWQVLSPKI